MTPKRFVGPLASSDLDLTLLADRARLDLLQFLTDWTDDTGLGDYTDSSGHHQAFVVNET